MSEDLEPHFLNLLLRGNTHSVGVNRNSSKNFRVLKFRAITACDNARDPMVKFSPLSEKSSVFVLATTVPTKLLRKDLWSTGTPPRRMANRFSQEG